MTARRISWCEVAPGSAYRVGDRSGSELARATRRGVTTRCSGFSRPSIRSISIRAACNPATMAGFKKGEEVFKAGYLNEDFAAAKFEDGVRMVATGEVKDRTQASLRNMPINWQFWDNLVAVVQTRDYMLSPPSSIRSSSRSRASRSWSCSVRWWRSSCNGARRAGPSWSTSSFHRAHHSARCVPTIWVLQSLGSSRPSTVKG